MHADPFLVLSLLPLGASLWWDLRALQINAHLCCPEVWSVMHLSFPCCSPHLLRCLLEVSAQEARLLFSLLHSGVCRLLVPCRVWFEILTRRILLAVINGKSLRRWELPN